MSKYTKSKKIALAAGCGVLAVILGLWWYHNELLAWYLQRYWSRIAVVVLDNCDPNYKGTGWHADGVRFLSKEGRELFRTKGLNNCEAIGINHGVTLDPARFRIYVRENVANRVTAMYPTGKVLYKVDIDASAIEVDPETGYLWCLIGGSLNAGETVVLDLTGERLAVHPIKGFDIAYNAFDKTFWAVGYEIVKFDNDGKIMTTKPKAGWARVSVAPNHQDGSVWIAERRHPQSGGVNRVIRLDSEGNMLNEVSLADQTPFAVSCHPRTGMAWVVDLNKAMLRVPVDGDPLAPIDIPARAVTISPRTGRVWVATQSEILALDEDGEIVVKYSLDDSSSNTWLAAP